MSTLTPKPGIPSGVPRCTYVWILALAASSFLPALEATSWRAPRKQAVRGGEVSSVFYLFELVNCKIIRIRNDEWMVGILERKR